MIDRRGGELPPRPLLMEVPMLVVRVEEAMRVAPEGHVIDLKAGEETSGSLAEYLVATRCNVTVVEGEPAAKPEESAPDAEKADGAEAGNDGAETESDSEKDDGALSASLAATAAVAQDAPGQDESAEGASKPVKQTRARKAVAK